MVIMAAGSTVWREDGSLRVFKRGKRTDGSDEGSSRGDGCLRTGNLLLVRFEYGPADSVFGGSRRDGQIRIDAKDTVCEKGEWLDELSCRRRSAPI
jgi:hypothetical protein